MKYMSIILTSLFMSLNHPLMMTITILMQLITSCMMMGLILKNFWLPYMLMIILLGGLMIMFMYMCSTTPNQMMKLPSIIMLPSLTTLMVISTSSSTNKSNKLLSSNYSNSSPHNLNMFNILMNIPNHLMFPTMMLILLFMMMTSTKISYTSEHPLRSH